MWYLILRGKQKEKNIYKTQPKTKFLPISMVGTTKVFCSCIPSKTQIFLGKIISGDKSGEFSVPCQLTKLTMFGLNNFENTSVIVEENGGNVESDC